MSITGQNEKLAQAMLYILYLLESNTRLYSVSKIMARIRFKLKEYVLTWH